MKTKLLTLAVLALASCQMQQRTTTSNERAWANLAINKVVLGITALQAAGTIDPEDAQLALAQLNDLRELVDSSATHEVTWVEVVDRVLTIAAQWAIPVPRSEE